MHLLALASLLLAQSPATHPEVRAVVASIVDDAGQPLRDLTADDVALVENGVARPLKTIDLDRRPLRLAILVDSSQPISTPYRLNVVPVVAEFVDALPAGTRYALWVTGDRAQKIVDHTDERARALAALQRVAPQGGNVLLDALIEAEEDLVAGEGERAALVVVTGDGVGFANHDRRTVADRLKDTDATVYAVQFRGAVATSTGGDPGSVTDFDYDYVLDRLVSATGGHRERVLAPMAVGRALSQVLAELTGRYRLTYETMSGIEKREISLEVAHPGARVRVARPEGE